MSKTLDVYVSCHVGCKACIDNYWIRKVLALISLTCGRCERSCDKIAKTFLRSSPAGEGVRRLVDDID